jgi:DNA repair exonuclease SbcCD ATPase subunit
MHLEKFELSDMRVFQKLTWDITRSTQNLAGWHVLLGENGSGKSSILRALALALTGPQQAAASRVELARLVRAGEKSAEIKLHVRQDKSRDFWSETGRQLKGDSFSISVQVGSDGSITKGASANTANRTLWGEGFCLA